MKILSTDKLGSMFLLLAQMLERIVFYSISANFYFTLNSNPLQWTAVNTMSTTFLHSGFCFVFTMVGGILADTVIKKSTTVIIGYIFYIAYVGFIIIFQENKDSDSNNKLYSLCSHKTDKISHNIFDEACSNILIPTVIFCAIGSGLIKSVMASIGSDMAVKYWTYPSVFFNMYYWSLNVGSLISFAAITFIQQNVSKFYGFLAPGICLFLSFVLFLLGLPYYVVVPKSSKSTLNLVYRVYFEAFQKKFSKKKNLSEKVTNTATDDPINSTTQASFKTNDINTFYQQRADYPSLNAGYFNDSDNSSDETSTIVETTMSESTSDILFLDRSKIRFGGKFSEDDVEDVRKFSTTLILIAFIIPYWLLYFQMETTYMKQGFQLNSGVTISSKNLIIPAAWLSMIDILTIMFLLPILVRFVYPYLRKKNLYPDFIFRIVFGMILAVISMIAAGILQIYVDNDIANNRTITRLIGGTYFNQSNISIYSQVPQYFIIGISESQTIVAGLELACTQVPTSMQAVTNGIFWFFSGIGSFLGTALLSFSNLINKEDKNHFYYFFVLAIIQTVFILLLLPWIWKIRRNKKIHVITTSSTLTN
uniref:Slc15a-5 n=1 Tax=Schmidtea mediterranea TaxID=79327 RepID=A0A0H3YIZ0_SCHMD|nr:slc15a-5 [Schmidtea mediterranea]